MPSIDIMMIGLALLGSVLGLFKKPWWSVPLAVTAAVVIFAFADAIAEQSTQKLAMAFLPESLFIGVGVLSMPALAGWVIGSLLHMLSGR